MPLIYVVKVESAHCSDDSSPKPIKSLFAENNFNLMFALFYAKDKTNKSDFEEKLVIPYELTITYTQYAMDTMRDAVTTAVLSRQIRDAMEDDYTETQLHVFLVDADSYAIFLNSVQLSGSVSVK